MSFSSSGFGFAAIAGIFLGSLFMFMLLLIIGALLSY